MVLNLVVEAFIRCPDTSRCQTFGMARSAPGRKEAPFHPGRADKNETRIPRSRSKSREQTSSHGDKKKKSPMYMKKKSCCELINLDVQPHCSDTMRRISIDMTHGGTLPSPAEHSHTDVRRPNTVEQKSTGICLHISVTSAHVP